MALIEISDVGVLQNTVRFSTAQRAFAASMVIAKATEEITQEEVAFLVIEGLSCFVTASEDLLGWVSVLRQWAPEHPETQLFSLLDKVNVGPELEGEILEFLKGLEVSDLRDLLRLPPGNELTGGVLTATEIEDIERALPYILDGLIQIVEMRVAKNRSLVVAFNKAKHMLLAFPHDKDIRLARIETGNELGGLTVPIDIEYAIGRARQAIESQAVLHSTLGLILTANGSPEPTAEWVKKAMETWADPF